jgi:beta-phosphoglucomutase
MLGAVIFDFDGVIADSETLHLRAFNQMLSQFTVEIATDDYYRDYLGLSDIDLLRELRGRGILAVETGEIEELARQKKKIFEKLVRTGGRIIDGVREFLAMLRDNVVPMAICSGALAEEIEMILDKSGLGHFFEVIVSAEQVARGKPHPDGFVLALEKLNFDREEPIRANQCVVIEDSRWGLEAAKAAGMHTVAITNSYDAQQLGMAEKVIGHLSELSLAQLKAICQGGTQDTAART